MSSWHVFYASDLQSLWALLVVPFAFLVYRAVGALGTRATDAGPRPASARFLEAYTLVFAIETMLDPVVGGPIARALGLADGAGGTIVVFAFVLLGDLRVFALLFGLGAARGGDGASGWLRRAALYTLVVPIATGVVYGSARALEPELPGQVMWLVYELSFLAMTGWLALREVGPAARGDAGCEAVLRSCLGYVAAYYALWATCDVLILAGVDEGWALRSVPNQLYYGLWVPFVWARSAPMRSR